MGFISAFNLFGKPKMPNIQPIAPPKTPPPPPAAPAPAPSAETGAQLDVSAQRAAAEEANRVKARRKRSTDIGTPSPSSLVSKSTLGG